MPVYLFVCVRLCIYIYVYLSIACLRLGPPPMSMYSGDTSDTAPSALTGLIGLPWLPFPGL